MTERTIRSLAKELAGRFYDTIRTAESKGRNVQMSERGRTFLDINPLVFGKTFPTVQDYLIGRRHGAVRRLPDGRVEWVDTGTTTLGPPGWVHWYGKAREMAVAMLTNPGTHPATKDAIMDALIEDRQKQLKTEAKVGPAAAIFDGVQARN